MGKRNNKGGISRDRVERAARIYSSNKAAAEALDIRPGSFSRLCKKYSIESPQQRRERMRGQEPITRIEDIEQDEAYCDCGAPKPKGKLYCLTCETLIYDAGGQDAEPSELIDEMLA